MTRASDHQFVSIDWGTTHFRLYLVNTNRNQPIYQLVNDQGVKKTHQQCRETGGEQKTHYLQLLEKELLKISHLLTGKELVLVSGMASSSLGMVSLPYATLPFSVTGSDAVLQEINFPLAEHRLFLISGVRSDQDVMRGEEMQIIGLADQIQLPEYILILPGTHSKHVAISNGILTDFKTYLTGELFQIISQYSVLKESLHRTPFNSQLIHSFCEGVGQSEGYLLLNELFKIRVRDLFGSKSRDENFYFLSGLLIGYELRNLNRQRQSVIIGASGELADLYLLAGDRLNLSMTAIEKEVVDHAVINGQRKIIDKKIVR